MKALLAQTKAELLLASRQKERLLATIFVPAALLVFLKFTPLGRSEGSLLAPVVATAVMASAMVGLGIATSFERRYLILKRLGATPLGRPRLIAAKGASVLVVLLIQVAASVGAGLALGETPNVGLRLAVPLVLGAFAFTALGMMFAGTLNAEANLAVLNGLFLLLLLLGGIAVPIETLPAPVEAAARLLPAAPLTGLLSASFAGFTFSQADLTVLLAWALGATVIAGVSFRWE